jgi:hypothetical protein
MLSHVFVGNTARNFTSGILATHFLVYDLKSVKYYVCWMKYIIEIMVWNT